MSESFVKFKQRFLVQSIIKSAMCALGTAFTISGLFMLLTKLEVISVKPIFIVLSGVLAMLFAGGVSFLLLRRSDRQLARQLDRELGLQEKLQTMIQYRNEDDAIYRLQRADASMSLDAAASHRIGLKFLWVYIIGFVLGLAILVVAFLISSPEEPQNPDDTSPFELTAIQEASINELIEYVESTDMTSPYKENVASHLKTMLSELKAASTVSQRDAALDKANKSMLAEGDNSSPALEIINAMGASESRTVKLMAVAINYYDWSLGTEWDDFTDGMTEARLRITSEAQSSEETVTVANLKAVLTNAGSGISTALLSSGTSNTSELYIRLIAYTASSTTAGAEADGFYKISEHLPDIGYTAAQKSVDALFSANNTNLFLALEQEALNTGTCEYAVKRVCEIFGTDLPKFERPTVIKGSEEEPDGGQQDSTGNGGIGIGTVYGSNDLVLNPNTDEYVEYGTLIDEYYSLMFNKKEDGDYTEEEKQAMEKYFEILYGGFKNDD